MFPYMLGICRDSLRLFPGSLLLRRERCSAVAAVVPGMHNLWGEFFTKCATKNRKCFSRVHSQAFFLPWLCWLSLALNELILCRFELGKLMLQPTLPLRPPRMVKCDAVDGRNPVPPGMHEALYTWWDIYHINWCRIFSINSSSTRLKARSSAPVFLILFVCWPSLCAHLANLAREADDFGLTMLKQLNRVTEVAQGLDDVFWGSCKRTEMRQMNTNDMDSLERCLIGSAQD